jgi:hypothetical protein
MFSKLIFSEENIQSLEVSIIELKAFLAKEGFNYYNQILTNILAAAYQKDDSKFRNFVDTNELFGGAGALWEIDIRDQSKKRIFHKYFSSFINSLKQIGIKNRRIKQVSTTFN